MDGWTAYRGCTGGGVSEGADILGVRRRSCRREIDVDDVSGGFGVGWGRVVEWHRGGRVLVLVLMLMLLSAILACREVVEWKVLGLLG